MSLINIEVTNLWTINRHGGATEIVIGKAFLESMQSMNLKCEHTWVTFQINVCHRTQNSFFKTEILTSEKRVYTKENFPDDPHRLFHNNLSAFEPFSLIFSIWSYKNFFSQSKSATTPLAAVSLKVINFSFIIIIVMSLLTEFNSFNTSLNRTK